MSKQGLTVIELALIVAIMASLAMIIAPMFEAASPKVTAESEGLKIIARIRTMQHQAIDKSREYKLRFVQGTDTIEISYVDENGVEREMESFTLDRSIDLAGTTFARDTLSFNILGEPTEGGKIELRSTMGEKIHIQIAPRTGKTSLEKAGR